MADPSISEQVVAYQERRFASEGPSARGLDWRSADAQQLLFRIIYSMGLDSRCSVLDVGCGLAHFYDFLLERGFKGRYSGIDLSPLLVDEARCRHPELDVRVTNLLLDPTDVEQHDFVVASGIFSARLDIPPDEFELYAQHMIERMYGLCRRGTVFNMLTHFVDFEAPHLYYADPGAWLSRARRLSRFLRLNHDPESYFFTLGIFREANAYDG